LKTPNPVKLLLYSKAGAADRLKNYSKAVGGEPKLMILGTIRHGLLMSAMNAPRHSAANTSRQMGATHSDELATECRAFDRAAMRFPAPVYSTVCSTRRRKLL
jgi:hypothetical protein